MVTVMSERKPVLPDKAWPQEKPPYQSLPDLGEGKSPTPAPSSHPVALGGRGPKHGPGHRLAKGLRPSSAGLCVCALSHLRPPHEGGCTLEQRKQWLREVLYLPQPHTASKGSLQKPLCPEPAILDQAGSSLPLPQAAHPAERPQKDRG